MKTAKPAIIKLNQGVVPSTPHFEIPSQIKKTAKTTKTDQKINNLGLINFNLCSFRGMIANKEIHKAKIQANPIFNFMKNNNPTAQNINMLFLTDGSFMYPKSKQIIRRIKKIAPL